MTRNKIIKLFSVILIAVNFVSCSHNTKKVEAVNNKALAVVVSGCIAKNKNSKKPISCTATWKNSAEESFSVYGNMDAVFVKPGCYEFVRYEFIRSLYQKFPDAISIFNKLEVHAGDVLYIGQLNADFTQTRQVLSALSFSEDSELAKTYLSKKYPSLTNKMKYVKIEFSPIAQSVKNFCKLRF